MPSAQPSSAQPLPNLPFRVPHTDTHSHARHTTGCPFYHFRCQCRDSECSDCGCIGRFLFGRAPQRPHRELRSTEEKLESLTLTRLDEIDFLGADWHYLLVLYCAVTEFYRGTVLYVLYHWQPGFGFCDSKLPRFALTRRLLRRTLEPSAVETWWTFESPRQLGFLLRSFLSCREREQIIQEGLMRGTVFGVTAHICPTPLNFGRRRLNPMLMSVYG